MREYEKLTSSIVHPWTQSIELKTCQVSLSLFALIPTFLPIGSWCHFATAFHLGFGFLCHKSQCGMEGLQGARGCMEGAGFSLGFRV